MRHDKSTKKPGVSLIHLPVITRQCCWGRGKGRWWVWCSRFWLLHRWYTNVLIRVLSAQIFPIGMGNAINAAKISKLSLYVTFYYIDSLFFIWGYNSIFWQNNYHRYESERQAYWLIIIFSTCRALKMRYTAHACGREMLHSSVRGTGLSRQQAYNLNNQ